MKKIIAIAVLLLSIISCTTEETNLKISGEIKGLKKGTIYLQKIKDTSLVNVDSIVVNGNAAFTFETFIAEPQMLYLFLDKVDNDLVEERIGFFAEPGEMSINTSLKKFGVDVTIEGSENQKKLEEYQAIMRKFNVQNLDLIKERFEAERTGNDTSYAKATGKMNNLTKRKYLYTINFAINNKDKELAPYLVLSETFDANTKFLDTVYKSLVPQVQNSLYGQELESLIAERKELEKELEQTEKEEMQ